MMKAPLLLIRLRAPNARLRGGRPSRTLLAVLTAATLAGACGGQSEQEGGGSGDHSGGSPNGDSDSGGSPNGDGDGDGDSGGSPNGDGDGDSGGSPNGDGDGDGDGDSGGSPNGDGDGDSGGSPNGDGDGECATGSEGCVCYGNGTCDLDLSCLSDLCVDAAVNGDGDGDTGGSGAGGMSSGGSGGGTSNGGSGGGGVCACDAEQSCLDGECVDWVCEPNGRFCSGNAVRLCAVDGLGSGEYEACAAGSYCDVASAECVAGVCTPDEPVCDGNNARWCNITGSGYEPGGTPCDSDETCDAGLCEPHVCPPGEEFCDGQQVMACAENGLSLSVVEACENQACLESDGTASCGGVCEPGGTQCSGNGVQTCSPSGVWGAVAACGSAEPFCSNGDCTDVPPSCQGLAATCGPNGNESCCTSLPVTGGTFYRGENTSYPGSISSFRLDKYEVTVGRFRKFVAAWSAGYRPTAGAGKHTHLNGGAGLSATAGGNEPGWDTAWVSNVDTSDAARGTNFTNWTSGPGANEGLPINYVNWFESVAFCIWDGGFLASEAEWEYAAAGGAEERTYPWGEASPDCSYANMYHGGGYCVSGTHSAPVGSLSTTGDGLWGQCDLAGNLYEWTLDWYASPFSAQCNDCTNASGTTTRVFRGGYWGGDSTNMSVTARYSPYPPTGRVSNLGLRCARAL